jgi:UDP-glucose 4-epimerase
MPIWVLQFAGRLMGKSKEIDRLLGSLVLDSCAIEYDLEWQPPFSMQDGLTATATWFRESHNL